MKFKMKLCVRCLFLLLYFPFFAGAQTFNSPGTFTYTVPSAPGLYTITVQVWGGGGGGGLGGGGIATGGGGGGAYATATLVGVPAGSSYSYTVGVGGGPDGAGGASSFGSNTVQATGGGFGTTISGGAGGTVTYGTGYNGGNGAPVSTGPPLTGGGGGGSAFTNANGNPGSGQNGGTGTGNGGNGGKNNSDATDGIQPGGGGGGRGDGPANASGNKVGIGAAGRVTITTTCSSAVGGTSSTTTPAICSGSAASLSLSGQVGAIQWQSRLLPAGTFANIPGATSASLTNTPSSTGSWEYRAVLSNVCNSSTANSTVTTIVVSQSSVGGSLSGGTSPVCFNTGPGQLSLTGSTGTLQWQSQYNGGGFSNIVGQTGTTYTPASNIAAGTWQYQVVATSGSCPAATSSVRTIQVDATSAGGNIMDNPSICAGNSTGSMALTGQVGTVNTWQVQFGAGSFSDIPMSAGFNSWSDVLSTPGIYHYRAMVQSGACSAATSGSNTVTVSAASVGGSITPPTSPICLGTPTGSFTLSGHTGTVTAWQKRLAPAGTFTDIGGTAGLTMWSGETPSSAGTWEYRVVVTSGACASSTSAVVSIVVNSPSVGGTISGGKTPICTGDDIGNFVLNGYNGSIQWQRSDNGMGFMDIMGATNSSFSENLNTIGTYQYRAVVTNGACATATSDIKITVVNQASVGGTSATSTPFIDFGQSASMTLSGETGSIQWMRRLVPGIFSIIPGQTSNSLTDTPSGIGTWEYVAVVTNTPCPAAFSSISSVVVTAVLPPLPIELVRFIGFAKTPNIELEWQTASERNNKSFLIERSQDGSWFTIIGEVAGNGNSSVIHDYHFTDKTAFDGFNYYRLKQLDFDGKFEYSPTISVLNHKTGEIAVYPTLAQHELKIALPEDAVEETSIKIYAVNGSLVFQQLLEGKGILTLDLPSLPDGQYLVQVINGNLTKQARIISTNQY